MTLSPKELIEHYQMTPHPEGGHYAETYRSNLEFETQRGKRNASTAIHFLLQKGERSHLHRLTSDEGWHWHLGDTLRLIEITPEGRLIETKIGPHLKEGEVLQHIVPAGHWFASETTGDFSFVGCTVSPGFDFSDFEMANRKALETEFPHLSQEVLGFSLT